MEPSIFKFIIRHSLRDQIRILLLTLVSFPFVYATLEVPKRIINDAIGGANVPDQVLGLEVDRVDYLLLLCALFLGLVLINGGIKYVLNVYRGIVGEKALRALRYELFQRLLRFPVPRFRRVSQGELIPIITAETEPLGGFVGEAFALPAFQGGLLLTYLFFIFNQDPFLGAAAVALYPLQMYLIPKLQRQVNQLNKARVLAARRLGERIGDTMAGIETVHSQDTSHYERAVVDQRLQHIFLIRLKVYYRKFLIKFLNNFMSQVTPFFFYAVGGYFVIQGDLSLGALVAVLAAYKDLDAPWKELLKYYQDRENVRIKYQQIIEQFDLEDLQDERLLEGPVLRLDFSRGGWQARQLCYAPEPGMQLLEQLNLDIPVDAHCALVGAEGSGADALGQLLARLLLPTSGRLTLAGADLRHLPESSIGQHLGYVGSGAHLFAGSIRHNLLYGLYHRRQESAVAKAWMPSAPKDLLEEVDTRQDAPGGSWIDLQALGMADDSALEDHLHQVLDAADLGEDLFRLGLGGCLPENDANLVDALLVVRERMSQWVRDDQGGRGLVEPFDWNLYNQNLSVRENLLFGTLRDESRGAELLSAAFFCEQGLLADFLEIGRELAATMVDLFADVDEGSDLFERFSFIRAEDLPYYRELLKRTRQGQLDPEDREICASFLKLTLVLCPVRHRLGLIDAAMQQRILAARHALAQRPEAREVIEFFDEKSYNPQLSLMDNLAFGRLAYGQVRAAEKVAAKVRELVAEQDLERPVRELGLSFDVGVGGGRLSVVQRQKVAVARVLAKKPQVVILNRCTSAMDPRTEAQVIAGVRNFQSGLGVILVASGMEGVEDFDRLYHFEAGRLQAQGTLEEVQRQLENASPGREN